MTWDPKLDEMLSELEKDDRLGDQIAVVQDISDGSWDDGRTRKDIHLILSTARDFKIRLTLSQPQIKTKAEVSQLTSGVRSGIRLNLQLLKQLHEFYGVSYQEIESKLPFGTHLGVKVIPDPDKKTGKMYVRIGALKPLAEVRAQLAGQPASAASEIPF